MINWMTDKDETKLTNSTFGNYENTTPTINLGRTSFGFISGSYWYQDPFANIWTKDNTRQEVTEAKTGYLWTTGASNQARMKNIYDVAGNLWEWTEETSFYQENSSTQCRVLRGGGFTHSSSKLPVCYRDGSATVSDTYIFAGFRPVLYMK